MSLEKLTIRQISCILWKPSPPVYPSLSSDESSQQLKISFLKIHLHLDLQIGIFTSGFLTKIVNAFLFYPMHNSCSSTGLVEMIWAAIAQNTSFGTVFNILLLLQSKQSCANLFHVSFYFSQQKKKSTFAMQFFSVKVWWIQELDPKKRCQITHTHTHTHKIGQDEIF